MANNSKGLSRLIKAAGYSWQGLRAAWQNEAAFRQEAIVAIAAVIVACWLHVTPVERILMIGSVFLILIIEIINSAIEAVVDRISLEQHPLAGRAKDMASAAVTLMIILALFTWITVLLS